MIHIEKMKCEYCGSNDIKQLYPDTIICQKCRKEYRRKL